MAITGEDVRKAMLGWPRCPVCGEWLALTSSDSLPSADDEGSSNTWECSRTHYADWRTPTWLGDVDNSTITTLCEVADSPMGPDSQEATLRWYPQGNVGKGEWCVHDQHGAWPWPADAAPPPPPAKRPEEVAA